MKRYLIWLLGNRALQHLAFWVLSFYFIGSYFSISNKALLIDFIYALFFHIPLIFSVYLNLHYIIPLLRKEKYLLYCLGIAATLAVTYGIHELVFEKFIPSLPLDYYMVSFTDIEVLLLIFSIYLIFTTLIKFSRSWFMLEKIKKEKLAWELKSLKSQINPHFMLNSLNTIYGLALQQKTEAPDAIMKLSNLVKQMIYGAHEHLIPLEKELQHLHDYLDLQRLRFTSKAPVSFTVSGDIKGIYIPPLLLMTFAENSFKHGMTGDNDEFFEFDVKIEQDELLFSATNSKIPGIPNSKGIGLTNVRRRLELIYNTDFTLHTSIEDKQYTAYLKIKNISNYNSKNENYLANS